MAESESRTTRAETGRTGERLALRYLRRRGYRILRRNCRTRRGEIDIIAADGEEVVFVEVRTLKEDRWGDPAESITPSKQRRISAAARTIAGRAGLLHRPLRFDVVAVILGEGKPEIRHYVDAFHAPGG